MVPLLAGGQCTSVTPGTPERSRMFQASAARCTELMMLFSLSIFGMVPSSVPRKIGLSRCVMAVTRTLCLSAWSPPK